MRRRRFVMAAVAGVWLAASPAGLGGVVTWDGGAGTSSWIDANNWNPNGVPGPADDVVIGIVGRIDSGWDWLGAPLCRQAEQNDAHG